MSVAIWPFVVLNKINEMKNEMRCHGEDDSTEKAEPNCMRGGTSRRERSSGLIGILNV